MTLNSKNVFMTDYSSYINQVNSKHYLHLKVQGKTNIHSTANVFVRNLDT